MLERYQKALKVLVLALLGGGLFAFCPRRRRRRFRTFRLRRGGHLRGDLVGDLDGRVDAQQESVVLGDDDAQSPRGGL